jgi:hypothetical protein
MKLDRDTQQMPSSYLERNHQDQQDFTGGGRENGSEPPGQGLNTPEKH